MVSERFEAYARLDFLQTYSHDLYSTKQLIAGECTIEEACKRH